MKKLKTDFKNFSQLPSIFILFSHKNKKIFLSKKLRFSLCKPDIRVTSGGGVATAAWMGIRPFLTSAGGEIGQLQSAINRILFVVGGEIVDKEIRTRLVAKYVILQYEEKLPRYEEDTPQNDVNYFRRQISRLIDWKRFIRS